MIGGRSFTPVWQTPLTGITPNGSILKQRRVMALAPWLGACAQPSWIAGCLNAGTDTIYAVPRPVGLSSVGDVMETHGGVSAPPRQFLELDNAFYKCDLNGSPTYCNQFLDGARSRGFSSITHDACAWIVDRAEGSYGLLSSVNLGRILPSYDSFQDVDWNAVKDSISSYADHDGILTLELPGEPLVHGARLEDLREAVYNIRQVDSRHPIALNEEPDLCEIAELKDIANVWNEDFYVHRKYGGTRTQRFAMCELLKRLSDLNDIGRSDLGTKLHTLAAFTDGPCDPPGSRVSASRDTIGALCIAQALMDVDIIGLFSGHNCGWLANLNPDVWEDLAEVLPAIGSLLSWKRGRSVYEVGQAPIGYTGTACDSPPVVYGYGEWVGESCGESCYRRGTWFAVAALGYGDTTNVVVPIADLQLPAGTDTLLDVVATSIIPPLGLSFDESIGIECRVQAGAWAIALISSSLAPGTATENSPQLPPPLRITSSPNPWRNHVMIHGTAASDSCLQVAIYSAGGTVVRSVTEDMGADCQRLFLWDGRDDLGRQVPSGMYFARVRSDKRAPRTITLVRVR